MKTDKAVPATPKKEKQFERKFMRPDELADRWGLSLSCVPREVRRVSAQESLFRKIASLSTAAGNSSRRGKIGCIQLGESAIQSRLNEAANRR
jgi:hypothetical protein